MKSVPLLTLALGVLARPDSAAETLCPCAVSGAECETKIAELFSCWEAAGGACKPDLTGCPNAAHVRALEQGCGVGGRACPAGYDCRVPGASGAGLCTPQNMGSGFNYGNVAVGAPVAAPVVKQAQPPPQAGAPLPAWPVAGAAAPATASPRATIMPVQAPAPVAAAPKASSPAVPVAVQPPRPTSPPQLGPPRPAGTAPPPQTITVTGTWTPKGQNPPRPVREPPRQQPQQQPARQPPPQQQQQAGPYPAGPYPNQPTRQPPPPPFPNQQGPYPNPAGPYPRQGAPNTNPVGPYPKQQGRQPPRQQQQQPPRGSAAKSSGRKMPLKVGKCSERERAAARCRTTELCFPHPIRPVCVNPTTADDCGYSRNQKIFGLGRFKECRSGEMCLVDYRATDGDDGICAVEPR